MKQIISLDVGGSKVLGVAMDEQGNIIKRTKVKTAAHKGQGFVIERIISVIEDLTSEQDTLLGISVILPCVLSDDEVMECSNVPLQGVPLKETLWKKFQVPVVLGNDVNLALLGEIKRLEVPVRHAVGVFVGTGVGGGLYLDGKLYLGLGAAGEIGHMNVVDQGKQCGCGGFGCLESYAGKSGMKTFIETAIKRQRKSVLFEEIDSEGSMITSSSIADASEAGDELAEELVDTAVHYLAQTIANLNTLLHPELFILGGGVIESLPGMIERIEAQAKNLTMPSLRNTLRLTGTKLGDDAGVIGGYYLLKEQA